MDGQQRQPQNEGGADRAPLGSPYGDSVDTDSDDDDDDDDSNDGAGDTSTQANSLSEAFNDLSLVCVRAGRSDVAVES
jgi:hypothetical protein